MTDGTSAPRNTDDPYNWLRIAAQKPGERRVPSAFAGLPQVGRPPGETQPQSSGNA